MSDGKFQHKHVKGETDPEKIKEAYDKIKKDEAQARDRVVREQRAE